MLNLIVFPLVMILPLRSVSTSVSNSNVAIDVLDHATYDLIRRDMKRLGQKTGLEDLWLGDYVGGGVDVNPKIFPALRSDLLLNFWIELRARKGYFLVKSNLPYCDIKTDCPISSQEALQQCGPNSPPSALYSLLLGRHELTKKDLPVLIHYTLRPWLIEVKPKNSKEMEKVVQLFEGTLETKRQSSLTFINFQFIVERSKDSRFVKLIPAYPHDQGYFVQFRSPS